jgi:hypothetical protein
MQYNIPKIHLPKLTDLIKCYDATDNRENADCEHVAEMSHLDCDCVRISRLFSMFVVVMCDVMQHVSS